MSKVIKSLFCVSFFLLTFNFVGYSLPTNSTPIEQITVGDFIDLSTKEYKALNGNKLNFKERVEFRANKILLKRAVKKNELDASTSFAESSGFQMKWGPFVLGLLLGLIGVIGVLAFTKKPKKNAVLSALIGWGAWLILASILIL